MAKNRKRNDKRYLIWRTSESGTWHTLETVASSLTETKRIARDMTTSRHDPKGTTYNITYESIRGVRETYPANVTPIYIGVRGGCYCQRFIH